MQTAHWEGKMTSVSHERANRRKGHAWLAKALKSMGIALTLAWPDLAFARRAVRSFSGSLAGFLACGDTILSNPNHGRQLKCIKMLQIAKGPWLLPLLIKIACTAFRNSCLILHIVARRLQTHGRTLFTRARICLSAAFTYAFAYAISAAVLQRWPAASSATSTGKSGYAMILIPCEYDWRCSTRRASTIAAVDE